MDDDQQEEEGSNTLSDWEWQHELHMMAVNAGLDLRKIATGDVPREEAEKMINEAEGLLRSSDPESSEWVAEVVADFRAANRLPDPDRKLALAKAEKWADDLPGWNVAGTFELTGG